jgi:uncharacterized protein (DUF1499 family)
MSLLLLPAAGVALFIGLGIWSQKGEASGLQDGKLREPDHKPNNVCSEAGAQPERAIEPLKAKFADVADAIEATGGTITARSDDYISATYMSRIFKFVDDVEIRRDGDVTQIRSASRVGYSDRGANRKRVEMIRAHLQSSMHPET